MPSPSVDEVVRRSNYASWRAQGGWTPAVVERADGSTFWTADGRPVLDFASQLVATNLGHGNRAVAEAIARQARELPYVAPGFATAVRAELSRRLDAVLPGDLHRYFFTTSGTEANEAALKVARLATGRSQVIARERSYHGSTAASISVSGDPRRRPVEGRGTVPGTLEAPDCYCYRCPLGLTYPGCHVACAEQVEELIERSGDVAAMIVEPVVGTNGVLVPVPEYLPKIREITRRQGVLLIADEVMTGWGRTGAWFAVNHWNVVPDLLTTAKGITGGYAPLGLMATGPGLHEWFEDRYFPHGHTYSAHPVGLAAAVAAIGEYHRLGLVEKSRTDGEYLRRRLQEVGERHPAVGEVRGLGLFAAVELVRRRSTREPFNLPTDQLTGRSTVAEEVQRALWADGVYVLAWASHLLLAPPLIASREEIDRAVDALDRALGLADSRATPD